MKITVKSKYVDRYDEVDAMLVGGETGVFASWIDGQGLIHFAIGDDGGWWEIAIYSKSWLPQIIDNLKGQL